MWYSSSPTLIEVPPYCTRLRQHHPRESVWQTRAPENAVLSYLRDQHTVASLYAHRHALAILIKGSRADGQDASLVELLNRGLRQVDAAGGLGLGLDALHEHTVEEGNK